MFNQTFVDSTGQTRTPFTLGLSFLLQCCVVLALMVIPLIYTQILPSAQLRNLLVLPAPPVPHIPTTAQPQSRGVTRPVFHAQLVAPTVVPTHINPAANLAPPPDFTASGVPSGTGPDTLLTGVFGSVPDASGVAPPASLPPKSKPSSGPIRVGSIIESNLIQKVTPVYPPLAKSARVEGTVEFTAIIGKHGDIENLCLLRGHPLLVAAARNAVLQWKYRPTLLNGQPVEVITTITVNFTLNQ